MKKIVILLIVAISLLHVEQAASQDKAPAEIGIHTGIGFSTLSYDLNNGKRDNKLGGSIGVTGTYFFSKNFGILSGLEISCYNAKAKFNDLTTTYTTRYETSSIGGDDIEYRAKMKNYSEKQNLLMLNIPIMAQVQTEISSLASVYLQGGFKVGIPVQGKYTSLGTDYTTSAYFIEENGEIESNGQLMDGGLGTFTGSKIKSSLSKKISFQLSAEAGVKWAVLSNRNFYTGLFIDYGLNSVVDTKKNASVVEYDSFSDTPIFGANSILSSSYRTSNDASRITKKVVPFSVGIKLRLAFAMD